MSSAALQLTLPLFDQPRTPPAPGGGRRWYNQSDQFIDYQLRRSRRRTIGFLIDDRGLTVTAPRWVSVNEIELGLAERSEWIARKLVEWRDYVTRRERLEVRWENGASLPFIGKSLTMRLGAGHPVSVRRDSDELLINLPPGAGVDQMRNSVHSWLQTQARALFEPRVAHFGQLLGQKPKRWGLSSARTRWGSCAADGSIRLNWRLIHFPSDVIDYIIAHEVAHLREMNHSPKFWATVQTLFPEYEKSKEWLKHVQADLST